MEILCDDEGTVDINLTIKCPECGRPMCGRATEEAWNETQKLIVIPTLCPRCNFYGRIDIMF